MIKTIIFDLDGTLLDTLGDLTDSVNHVLENHNMPLRTLPEIRSFVGNGIPMLIKRAVKEGTSEEEFEQCLKEMMAWYKEHSQIKTCPYDGVIELLAALRERNIKTAVVTNKEESAAISLCNKIFGDAFDYVIGDNGVDKLKPAPDNVFRAMKLLGADNETTLYVGDSDVDMLTAKNSSLPPIGVLWGFRDKEVLIETGAKCVISSPNELLSLI